MIFKGFFLPLLCVIFELKIVFAINEKDIPVFFNDYDHFLYFR